MYMERVQWEFCINILEPRNKNEKLDSRINKVNKASRRIGNWKLSRPDAASLFNRFRLINK